MNGLRHTSGGTACPPYSRGPYVWDQMVTFTGGLAGVNTPGSVFYVAKTGNDSNDGKSWDRAFLTIQAGVDATTANKGDVVLVGPSGGGTHYNENVLITKNGIRLFAIVRGKETRVRASGADTLYPFSTPTGDSILGACFTVLANEVEIAGFNCDASGAYCGIYIGDGYRIDSGNDYETPNCYIHDILFKYGTAAIVYDGCAEEQRFYNNELYRQSDYGVYIGPGGSRTSKRIIISDNAFHAVEGYGVFLYDAVSTENVSCVRNWFGDRTAGTAMTKTIQFNGAGVHHAIGNWSASTNGISGSSTDFISGNYGANGADGTEVVAEA